MKTLYILFLGLLVSSGVMAQSCLPEGITFSSQTQIDNFPINYPNCSVIEGDVLIGDLNGTDIINLDSLSVLTSIEGFIFIYNNDSLYNLSGLNNLTTIGEYLWIESNSSLTSLTGLNNLISIGSILNIINNESLTSLSGLDNLNTIGLKLLISDNDALINLVGLENLTHIIGGYLIISENDALINLSGLDNLFSIDAILRIDNNNALSSLLGLENIDPEALMDLIIYNNPSLSNCETLWLCDYLVNSSLVIIYNNAIGCNSVIELANNCGGSLPCLPFGHYYFCKQSDIDNFQSAFPNCNNLAGYIIISGDDIINLEGLNEVNSIEGGLYIEQNENLNNLFGLENLYEIGEQLNIDNNNALTNLNGLDNINANSIEGLFITNNQYLSYCEVQSICNYLAIPGTLSEIYNNAPGCNSEQEVEEACESVSIDEINTLQNITIYPNPVHTTITIELHTLPSNNTSLILSNTNGQKIINRQIFEPITEIVISQLPAGIYIVKVWNDKDVMVQKVIKQ